MKTKSLEMVIEEESSNSEFQNCYAAIPPNGKICPFSGLRHTHIYKMLADGGAVRPYVRVVNLREPGTTKGKTLFHVGDFMRYLDWNARQQGSGTKRKELLETAKPESPEESSP